jgi:CRP-like cAMP-binding protein
LLAAVDAGNVVGELALLGSDRPRTANVVAATAVRALALKASELAPLARRNPEILTKLSIAVARALAERLRRANATIRSLTR